MAGLEMLQDEAVERRPADKPDSASQDLLDRIVDLFLLSEENRSDTETESFGFLLEQMAYAAGTERRADVANRLALSPSAPKHLIRRLAFDNITIARPVLQYSLCLSENDLTTLASKLDQDYLLAIAHRLRLSSEVTDILVDRGDSTVLVTAARNAGAKFSAESIARLSTLAEADHELRSALEQRPDLSPGVLRRIKSFIVDQLLAELAGNDNEDPPDSLSPVEDEASEAADNDTDTDGTARSKEDDEDGSTHKRAARRDESDSVYDPIRDSYASEKTLSKLARAGMLSESVSCMAKLTGMDTAMVKHCLISAELSALMVLCKANGFSNATFTTLLRLREANSEEGNAIDMTAMLQRYDAMQTHTAKRIIQYAKKKRS
jgi:uncharacterized protein (DUF2336 family)